MTPEVRDRLLELEQKLKDAERIPMPDGGKWDRSLPARSGVYAIWQGDKPVYVGEGCHLRHRLSDLAHGKHGFKKLAAKLSIETDEAASPPPFSLSYVTDFLGRSELEEFLTVRWLPESKLERIRYCDDFNEIQNA